MFASELAPHCPPRLNFLELSWLYANRLYPPGEKRAFRRRIRFFFSCLWWCRSTKTWFDYIQSSPVLQVYVDRFPFIAGKPIKRYMRRCWQMRERLNCLMSHYRLLLSQPAGLKTLSFCQRGATIATFRGRSETEYNLVLTCDAAQGREGEIAIELRMDTRRIYCLCGSFAQVDQRPVFVIGTMQGAGGEDGRQIVRDATKNLHHCRPRDLLIAATVTLASIFGADSLLAPQQKQHIQAGRSRAEKIHADFNSLWIDLGGKRRESGDFLLPTEIHYRPSEEIVSKRRAETLRRYALKQQIATDIRAALC